MKIGAVVLAAGQSQRMGQPKMLLPWRGNRSVIEQVVQTLLDAAVYPVVVVTGAQHDRVEQALRGLPVVTAYNDRYADSEMVTSLQVGMKHLALETDGLLIVLGDQPTIQVDVVRSLMDVFSEGIHKLIVPSYQMRRGHPWLVSRSLFAELLSMPPVSSLRDFLTQNAGVIHYVVVDAPGILKDMDTPEDYRRLLEEE